LVINISRGGKNNKIFDDERGTTSTSGAGSSPLSTTQMSQKSMRKEPLADISNTGINVKKPLANIPIAKITTRVIRKEQGGKSKRNAFAIKRNGN